MELLKLLSASQIAAQMISFFILLFILRVFLWKRFLAVLDQRRARIADELKGIEAGKALVEKQVQDYADKLSHIEETARVRMQEAAVEGRRMADAILDNAKVEAQKIIDGARLALSAEVANARQGLKKEIVDLAISAAEKVIQEKLTGEDDRKMVESFLKEMDKAK